MGESIPIAKRFGKPGQAQKVNQTLTVLNCECFFYAGVALGFEEKR
jgi:hypothetical protein